MLFHRLSLALVRLEVGWLEARVLVSSRVQDLVEVLEALSIAQLELLDRLGLANDFEHACDVLGLVRGELALLVLQLRVRKDVEGRLSFMTPLWPCELLTRHLLVDSA